jgi:hypothetical protein
MVGLVKQVLMRETRMSTVKKYIPALAVLFLCMVVGVLLYLLSVDNRKNPAIRSAREVEFRPELIGYVSVLRNAMSSPSPADAHRSGKLVILEVDSVCCPHSFKLGGYMAKYGELIANDPSEVGSLVLITLEDYTVIKPAQGIHGARMKQSAEVMVVEKSTGQIIARNTIWSRDPSPFSDILGQPGVGPPRPIRSELDIHGKEIWDYLVGLPNVEGKGASSGLVAPAAPTPILRYDGVYYSIGKNSGRYLRFYEDGTVLLARIGSPAPPERAAAFLNKAQPNIEQGLYALHGSRMEFRMTFADLIFDFSGAIDGEELILESQGVAVYQFVEISDMQP